ncbi:hypothetical protein TRFO_09733 [Tritrichomonas foetus]|uniref:Uncharacterized protein n=1 Tax=Tritrichomonas foetus TaxID=1144522 RepID=A0A1J4JGV9_9EUKA|nr:hypothetical protein TRFO_09733 [Tritrichomonas foetus]|eukprot:OHS96843.1 hypothetical protein TRFO_09733 [Tritrichomonas foetus]
MFTISNFLYLKNGNKNKINIKLIDVLTSPDNFVFLYNLKDIFRSQNNSKNSEFQNKKSIDMTRYDIKIKTISIKESVTSLFLNSHDNKISYIPSNSLIMINIPLISSDYFLAQQNYIILKENELNFQVDNINLEFTHKLYFQITQACKAYVINKSVNNSLSKENESDTSFILHFKLNSFTFQESDFGSIILQDVTFDKIKQSFHFKLGKIKSNIIHQTVLCDPTHFIQICFDNNYITIHFSQFDIFLDIEKIIQYISFYKSFKSWFLSLKDVIKPDSNQTNFNDFPMIQCILHDVNLHFPFPDDVLFKEHDLTMSLDLIMNSNNGSLELFVKVSNIYFSAIQSRVKFLPVLSDFSAKLTLKNGHDISIETGPLNIYLSIIDMVELQIIFDNIIRSISPMTTCRSLYYEEKKKSYLHFQYFVVDSISLYLCKENRQSNNYRVSGGVMSLPTLEVKSIHYIYK